MATSYQNLFLFVVAFTAMCTVVLSDWGPQNYPNPQKEPKKCGRHHKQSSWVCDPDRIITKKQANILDWFIEGTFLNDTGCACSAYACEKKNLGYHLGVALIRKMKRDANASRENEARLHDAKNFAYSLEHNQWNFGRCDDDVVIFYSFQDKILYTMAGNTAGMKLTQPLIQEINGRHGHHLQPGHDIGTGLIEIVLDYRRVLMGTYIPPYALQGEPILGGASHVMSAIVTSILVPFMAIFIAKL